MAKQISKGKSPNKLGISSPDTSRYSIYSILSTPIVKKIDHEIMKPQLRFFRFKQLCGFDLDRQISGSNIESCGKNRKTHTLPQESVVAEVAAQKSQEEIGYPKFHEQQN